MNIEEQARHLHVISFGPPPAAGHEIALPTHDLKHASRMVKINGDDALVLLSLIIIGTLLLNSRCFDF